MPDRYLLESSSVDGYLLEDGSGVLLLDVPDVAPSFTATQGNTSATETTTANLTWEASGSPAPTLRVQKLSTGGGGGVSVPTQTTSVGNGNWSATSVTFASPVAAGSVIVVMGSSYAALGTRLSSNQGDVFTVYSQDDGGGRFSFLAWAVAIGGSTTVTLAYADYESRMVAVEWPGLTFDSAAGVGTAAGTSTVTATTPNSITSADSVSFSVIAATVYEAFDQTIATGFTESGRNTATEQAFVAGYRVETTTGTKSATWTDPSSIFNRAVIIAVFSQPSGASWEDVTTGTNYTGSSPLTYTTPTLSLADDGSEYRAAALNTAGEVFSTGMVLSVTAGVDPTITLNPTDQSGAVGTTSTYTAAASGTAPVTGQWQVLTG